MSNSPNDYHVAQASAQPLLKQLTDVQKYGDGWRAKCPACGGQTRKLSITETLERVLVHCFAGCSGQAVIDAVGLSWGDLYPPRSWPASKDERRANKQALQRSAWGAALEVLSKEAWIVSIAATDLLMGKEISAEDIDRLLDACIRITNAKSILCGH